MQEGEAGPAAHLERNRHRLVLSGVRLDQPMEPISSPSLKTPGSNRPMTKRTPLTCGFCGTSYTREERGTNCHCGEHRSFMDCDRCGEAMILHPEDDSVVLCVACDGPGVLFG